MTNSRDFFKRILRFVAKYPTKSVKIQNSLTTTVLAYELTTVPEDIDTLLDRTHKTLFAHYRLVKEDSKYIVLIKYSPKQVRGVKAALS